MGGGYHYYFDAARALWDMPSEELYSFARGEPDAMRRAAELTLRLKAEFVTPESFRDERSVLTRLASALSEDPEFPMDLAVKLGRGRSTTAPPSENIQWVTRRSRRSVMLWVAVIAAVSLLVLDVLATAGVPVPSPIGDVLDRVTGEDVAPQTPAPPAPTAGLGIRSSGFIAPGTFASPAPTPRHRAASQLVTKSDKNPNYQNGKKRNHQNGKERNYQNGKETNKKGDTTPHPSRRVGQGRNVRSYAMARTSDAGSQGRTLAHRARHRPGR